jgi:Tol biopolymer transport system component
MKVRVAVVVLLVCASAAAQAPRQQIFFSRVFPVPQEMGLFIANADGSDETVLPGTADVDYDPAWSPDGGWIAYTSERNGSADLYRMKPDGASVERLTDSPAYDDQAAFSGDGQQLVFVTTRANGTADLWTLDVRTRRAKALTSGPGGDYRPSWSPDGSWIAFTSDRGAGLPFSHGRWEALQRTEIYLIHPDGSGLRQLTKRGEFCGSPKWSADSRRVITYCTTAQKTMDFRPRVAESGSTTLVSIDVNSGVASDVASGPGVKMAPAFLGNDVGYIRKDKPTGIAYGSGKSGPQGDILGAAWSPDARRVVYHKRVRPRTPSSNTGPKMWSRLAAYDLRLGGMQPSFDPSGTRYASADFVPTPEGNHLFVVDADTHATTTIFHEATRSALGPQWSAKGDAIVFGIGPFGAFFNGFHKLFLDRADRVDGGAQVAMIKPDGSGFRELTKGPNNNGFPSLAPDGARVVYRTFGPDGDGLRIMNLSSGAITTLTTGYDNFPLWSPRGDLIMFSRIEAGDYEVFTIRPDGSDVRRLTSTPGNDAHMGWSADGDQIVFSSSRMGFKDEVMYTAAPQPYGELFIMRYDGSDVRQLTDNQWEDGTPAWRPMPGQRASVTPGRH